MKLPAIQTRNSGKKIWTLLQALLPDDHKLQNNTYIELLNATFLRTVSISKDTHALNVLHTGITSQIITELMFMSIKL